MRTLRFPKAVYPGEQVDAAIKVYERFGTLGQSEEEGHWVVTIEASSPGRERKLEGELANYALGLTIRGLKAEASS